MNRQPYAALQRKPTKTEPPLDPARLAPQTLSGLDFKARTEPLAQRVYQPLVAPRGVSVPWTSGFVLNFPVSASGRCPRSRDIPAQTPEISAAAVGSERHQT
jgi:hypothetical protein